MSQSTEIDRDRDAVQDRQVQAMTGKPIEEPGPWATE
jgi:hypothetical protein